MNNVEGTSLMRDGRRENSQRFGTNREKKPNLQQKLGEPARYRYKYLAAAPK